MTSAPSWSEWGVLNATFFNVFGEISNSRNFRYSRVYSSFTYFPA